MDELFWIKLINEAIPFLLLTFLGLVTYKGFKKNQNIISEKEDLVKRYILFRGDKQARLKIYGNNKEVYQELLKNISDSWKNFKKTYDQYMINLSKNMKKTKRLLILFTFGLILNSGRLLGEEYYFFGLKSRFIVTLLKELSYYILVFLSFFLLKTQIQRFFSPKSEVSQIDREILFFPNSLSIDEEYESLYNEFDPINLKGEEDGK